MNKKAESLVAMLIEILVVIIVVGMVMNKAVGVANLDSTKRITIAEDMAMMVHVLVASPGNAVVSYPHDLSGYTIFLAPDRKVSVLPVPKDESKPATLPSLNIVRRPFNLPESYAVEGLVEGKQRACLEKTGRLIVLRECTVGE